MPSFFGRRYMRDGAPATERIIGLVCIAITAAIALLFVRDVRTHKPPFFSVDPSKQPPAVAAEIRHARSLLPESPAPGWLRSEPVLAYRPDELERSLPGEADRFTKAGLRQAFQGQYVNRFDARQQLVVRIFDMGAAAAAQAVFDDARPADAVGEPVGNRGWRSGPAAIGFQSGRYYTTVQATNVPDDSLLTPSLLARELADRQVPYEAVATAPDTEAPRGQKPAAPSQALLPSPTDGVWSAPEQIATYNPGNLWEKINGRAEQYLTFGFEQLTCGAYRLAADPGTAVDVFIYRHRDPTNAFGIFQAERPEQPERVDIGREGYGGKSGLFFIKGRHYVQMVAGEGSTATAEQMLGLGRLIADFLPHEQGGMWAEQVLPKADQVPGSFTFQARNAFNLDFLEDVFSADYEKGDLRLTLFISQAESPEAASRNFEQYAGYVQKLGKVLSREKLDDGERLSADISGEFDIIFTKGRYLGGATVATDLAAARARAVELRDALK